MCLCALFVVCFLPYSGVGPNLSFLGTSLLAVIYTFGEVYVNATKRKHFSKTGTTHFLGDFGLDVCCNPALSALP